MKSMAVSVLDTAGIKLPIEFWAALERGDSEGGELDFDLGGHGEGADDGAGPVRSTAGAAVWEGEEAIGTRGGKGFVAMV
jgi:hypothetical protein